MKKNLLCFLSCLLVSYAAYSQKYEYWIDSGTVNTAAENGSGTVLSIDIAGLAPGIHYFHCRAIANDGTPSTLRRMPFYLPEPIAEETQQEIVAYEYWIDYGSVNTVAENGSDTVLSIDIAGLAPGIHYFHCRAIANDGTPSTLRRMPFYLPEQVVVEDTEIVAYEYWIDNDTDHKVEGNGHQDMYQIEMDIASLTAGEHTFHFRAKNAQYLWGETFTETFVVEMMGDVNRDKLVDVDDVVGIVNKILGTPAEGFNEVAADVNGDGKIDVADVVAVVNIILSEPVDNTVRVMGRIIISR